MLGSQLWIPQQSEIHRERRQKGKAANEQKERVEDVMIVQMIPRNLVESVCKRAHDIAISRHESESWNVVGSKENKQHWISWAFFVFSWLYLSVVLKYHISNIGVSTVQKEKKSMWSIGWGVWDSYKVLCWYRKAIEEDSWKAKI